MAEKFGIHASIVPRNCAFCAHVQVRWANDDKTIAHHDKGVFQWQYSVYAFSKRDRVWDGAQTGEGMTKICSGTICAVVMMLVAFGGSAHAQADYPNRPIHFIVGFAAGGGNDLFARLVVQKFQENTGAISVIDNRVGAGGRNAAQFAARPPADRLSVLDGGPCPMSRAPSLVSGTCY